MPIRQNIVLSVQPTGVPSYQIEIPTTKNSFLIGRDGGSDQNAADLPLADDHVSRRHCTIDWDDVVGWTASDLNSTNGTQINGQYVHRTTPIKPGARILIGTTLILVHFLEDVSDDATQVADDDATQQITHDNKDVGIKDVDIKDVGNKDVGIPLPPKSISQDATAAVIATMIVLTPQRPESSVHLPRLLQELVNANMMDISKAETLILTARRRDITIFRALAQDTGILLLPEIFSRIAEKYGLEYIPSEPDLYRQIHSVPWLEKDTAKSLGILPLKSTDPTKFRYAAVDPFDIVVRDWILNLAQKEDHKIKQTQPVLTSAEALNASINRLVVPSSPNKDGEIGIAINISIEEEQKMSANLENMEVPSVVNFLVHRGYSQGASDIHIEPTESALLVRNRVDGILHDDSSLPMFIHPEVSSRIKIISGMDVAEKRRPQDGRISALLQGSQIDLRVSTFPTVYGEKVVMRILDRNALRPSVESLGLLPKDLQLVKDKVDAPFGLIMISGPTGSGKTTTLYSCLSSINKHAKNVLTVEDPVEYRLEGVHQMQVNDKIGLTFASGLRTILRQDPDVIMIGECRDNETAAMAIQAALTGHIVFSTIHTNDAVGVVTRLLDMKIDPFLVANAVSVALAQRLVRRICTYCSTKAKGSDIIDGLHADGVSDERMEKLGLEIDPSISYPRKVGCLSCRKTGYQGRQPVFEVFEMTNAARSLVMSPSFNADELRALARRGGMMTLIDHGKRLIDDGATTHEEVIRVLGETA